MFVGGTFIVFVTPTADQWVGLKFVTKSLPPVKMTRICFNEFFGTIDLYLFFFISAENHQLEHLTTGRKNQIVKNLTQDYLQSLCARKKVVRLMYIEFL